MLDAISAEDLQKKKKSIKRATIWMTVTAGVYLVGVMGLLIFGAELSKSFGQNMFSLSDGSSTANIFFMLVRGTQILGLITLAIVLVAYKSAAQYLAWWLILLVIAIVFLVRGLDFLLFPILFG
jgi:hypothetical protein